jgi:hypothetical protein
MDRNHLPRGFSNDAYGDLARLRKRASAFFESLSVNELAQETQRKRWISDWTRLGDDYRMLAESVPEAGSAHIVSESCLCALTAFEVARCLSHLEDTASIVLANMIDPSLSKLEDCFAQPIERAEIECLGQGTFEGRFLPAACKECFAPAIICVGDEEMTLSAMLSRLLPASLGSRVSLLLIDGRNASAFRSSKPEHVLGCWLDYLDGRPDVDSSRIAVYGEGLGASYASSLARSDRRIAAAVCDGGLWVLHRRRASVGWITGGWHDACGGSSAQPLPTSRRIPCPILMVVGHRSMVREEDALELQARYRQSGAHCSIVIPNAIQNPLGAVENFITVDDFVFDWLHDKLGSTRQLDLLTYL